MHIKRPNFGILNRILGISQNKDQLTKDHIEKSVNIKEKLDYAKNKAQYYTNIPLKNRSLIFDRRTQV